MEARKGGMSRSAGALSFRRSEMTFRHWMSLKVRFACSRLPWFPAIYRLQVYDESFVRWRWTCVMPFWKPGTGPFDFEMFGWDVLELRFLWCFLNPEMVFLDIGAYHGIYSVLAAKKLAGNCRVNAFE